MSASNRRMSMRVAQAPTTTSTTTTTQTAPVAPTPTASSATTASNAFSQSTFAAAAPSTTNSGPQSTIQTPKSSNSQPPGTSTTLQPTSLNTSASTSSLQALPNQPATPMGRASSGSISGYRTMRSLRSTMDPALYQAQADTPTSGDLPSHLNRNNLNAAEPSVTRTKEEFSVVKTKEEEEEDQKLRDKEKNLSWDDIKRLEDHAHQVRAEILSTEFTYVGKLAQLVKFYVNPLMELSPEQLQEQIGITAMHRTALVSNLTVIHGFQEKFNADLIKAGPMKAEETLIQYSHFFRLYSQYATDYQKMMDTIFQLANSKKFQAFTTIVDHQLAGQGGSGGSELLPSYLILPIQRIPRYELLLRELKRHTLPSKPEFETINKALSLVKASALHINETGKSVENKQKLVILQKRIKGDMKDFTLVQPFRRHLREATVLLSEPHKKSLFGTIKSGLRIVFLFNDIILWTNTDFEYKAHMNIASISQCTQVAPYVLEISTSEKCINLNFCVEKGMPPAPESAKGTELKNLHDDWFNDISQLVAETQAERRRKRQIQSRNDTTRTATHRLIVNKFNTLDRKQMEELQAEQARQREASIAEGQ